MLYIIKLLFPSSTNLSLVTGIFMLSTPHLLVGAAIIKVVPDPLLGLPLAFLSHFALDSIPHWDGSPKAPFSKKLLGGIAVDYALGASLVLALTINYSSPSQYIFWLGAFLATLPDFILGSYKHLDTILGKYAVLRVPNEFHMAIQRNVPLLNGMLISAVVSAVAVLILLF
jgi:hypothetical protein